MQRYVFRRQFVAGLLRRLSRRGWVFYYPDPSVEGTTCWGHATGATETNKLTFASNWTGTGAISGSGDAEKIVLDDGEYMESDETIHTGAVTVTLVLNKYGGGDTVTLKYRHGATDAAARAASWNTYSTPFSSDGYVQLRVEN